MKNRRHHVVKAGWEPVDTFAEASCDEMMQDVIGIKVLYNWLYQKEEENYYKFDKVSDFFPQESEQEALFVEN